MTDSFAPNSIGLVSPKVMHFTKALELSCGRQLCDYDIIYETYGSLNANKSNAVLICHALSGNHHAAGYHAKEDARPGWWNHYIGPGKAIDTQKFFVVAPNNIGGCAGSTGPSSLKPNSNVHWGADFPQLRVRDWVNSQARLADNLGIQQWAAVVGGSLGGMQAMRWAVEYPDRIRHCIVIAAALKLSAQNIAFNETARVAITSDPDFHEGHYLAHNTYPKQGLAIARMIGHITYLSNHTMGEKFGRELRHGSFSQGSNEMVEFQVESYLRYQGEAFSKNFDANTYILATHLLDYFDLAREYNNDPIAAFSRAQCSFAITSFTTDWRFAPERSREIVDALVGAKKSVTYTEISSPHGHDAFLLPNQRYEQAFMRYMKKIEVE